jgi:uncharacterized membrane protein
MFFSDLKFISFWWFFIFIFSLSFLPFIFSLFPKFFDRGYIFAKVLSLFTVTYIIFYLSVVRILPFTQLSIILVLIVINLFNFFFLRKHFSEFKIIFKNNFNIFLFEEILFFVILCLWSYVRGHTPDIEGLEKYMDWGFVNSALRSNYLPPADMWYALKPINYYYFGHLVFATLTKISSIPSTITYNLAIATLCSLTFVSAFSLVANLVKSVFTKSNRSFFIVAFISALLLTFGGNLHPIYKLIKNKTLSNYWYPDATRFIGFDPDVNDKTIHEFPLYSFVVSDLHGHVNDIPLVIFFMAFIFSYTQTLKALKIDFKFALFSGFILSLAYMTNAWDFAVYGLFFGIYLLLFSRDFKNTISNGLLTIFSWLLFTLPYSLNFTPMAEGIKISDGHSPFYQLFVLYGGFWLICLPFVIFIIKKIKEKNIHPSDLFVFSLIITATILIIIPELIYVKDIYIFEHRRANTMFKLVYQAFIMYSLASGYILYRFKNSFFYRLLFFVILVSHLIYPYYAIKSFRDSHFEFKYHSLFGLDYLKDQYPDNFALIEWINRNIKGQPNIVEAVGDSYTRFNQISSATGLPTIEGWLVHEWLWRGGYDGPGARAEEVRQIYESTDIELTKSILQKYDVKYVVVSSQEKEKYTSLNESKFLLLGRAIFTSGNTKFYELIK